MQNISRVSYPFFHYTWRFDMFGFYLSLLQLHGSPDVSVVAFTSDDFNIYAVSDLLHKRGWNLNTLQNPNALVFLQFLEQTCNVFEVAVNCGKRDSVFFRERKRGCLLTISRNETIFPAVDRISKTLEVYKNFQKMNSSKQTFA